MSASARAVTANPPGGDAVTRLRDDDAVALEWRPAHFSVGFDGYDERGMFVAQVVRYADIDHEHGHAVRGHFWRPFMHGVNVVQPGGSYDTPEGAMAAVKEPRS